MAGFATREKTWMCFGCGYVMDTASPADPDHHAAPAEGDLSLCMNCGVAYTRRDSFWQPMSHDEWKALDREERAELTRAAVARGLAIQTDLRKTGGSA